MDANGRRSRGPAPSGEVSAALADLERTGGAVLIVGDGPEWIGRHVRRRLLGDGSGGPCYRIHVSTAASGSFPPADPAAGAGERTTIGYVTARRTATRSAARSARDGRADRVCTTLPELGIAVSSAIEGFEERAASNRVGSVSVSTP